MTAPKGALRVKCQDPSCGKSFYAKRSTQKFCSPTCRRRAHRHGSASGSESELVKVVKAELRAAGKLATVHGQVAVKLATQLDGAGPSQTASLSRELDRKLELLLGASKPVEPTEPVAEPEPDDEVTKARRARDAKRAALRETAD